MATVKGVMMPEVDFGVDLVPDLAERLCHLYREGHRVVPVLYHGERAWVVLGYREVAKAFADEKDLPGGAWWDRDFDSAGKTLLHMRDGEHDKYKSALAPPFAPNTIRKLVEPILVPLADRLIDEFGARREVELHQSYNLRYSFNVISKILGIPTRLSDEEQLRALVSHLIQTREQTLPPETRRSRALEAVQAMNAYLRPLIEARRKAPDEGLISYILALRIDGRPLSEEEVFTWVRFFYLAGADTTGLMIGNVMHTILSLPGLLAELLAHPTKRALTINEAMRLYGVTGLLPRYAERDIKIGGVDIPANTYVLMGVPGANRDASYFANPDAFLPERKQAQSLGFGVGTHFCLGNHLAREEIRISVDRLLDRLPGLRFAGKPEPIGSCLFRFTPELRVRFDDLLPAGNCA
jgi:cytochrome P450